MVKKSLFIIFVGYFVSIVLSGCGNRETYEVWWTDFDIGVFDYLGDNPNFFIEPDYIIKKESFLVFRIFPKDDMKRIAQLSNSSLITNCMALTKAIDYKRIHTPISISVKTIYDYSESFPSGSDITVLFKGLKTFDRLMNKIEYYSIDEIISQLEILMKGVDGADNSFNLCLVDDSSCSGGKQKFEFTFLMSDGVILVNQTDELIFE